MARVRKLPAQIELFAEWSPIWTIIATHSG